VRTTQVDINRCRRTRCALLLSPCCRHRRSDREKEREKTGKERKRWRSPRPTAAASFGRYVNVKRKMAVVGCLLLELLRGHSSRFIIRRHSLFLRAERIPRPRPLLKRLQSRQSRSKAMQSGRCGPPNAYFGVLPLRHEVCHHKIADFMLHLATRSSSSDSESLNGFFAFYATFL